MTRFATWGVWALALAACASAPVRPATCPACPTCLTIRQEPAVDRLPQCAPPPGYPKVMWMPQGCPPQFGACLSGLDSAAVNDYLARCSRGR